MSTPSKKKRLQRTASLGEILQGIMNRQHGRAAPALKQISIWEKWDDAVGPAIAKQAWPLNFKAGVLFVGTSNPAWALELQYLKHKMQENLNRAVGKNLIKEIVIKRAKRER